MIKPQNQCSEFISPSFQAAALGMASFATTDNKRLVPAPVLDTFLDGYVDFHVDDEEEKEESTPKNESKASTLPRRNRFSLRRSQSAKAMPLSDRDRESVGHSPKLQRVLGLTAEGKPVKNRRPSMLARHMSMPRGLSSPRR